MKRQMLICLFLLAFTTVVVAQKPSSFKKDFNAMSFYNKDTGEWEEAAKKPSSIEFNINDNGDVKVNLPGGTTETLRSVGTIKKTSSNGEKYDSMRFLDQDGKELELHYFDDGDVIIAYSNGVQFLFTKL